jgi:hypothetical protein
MDIHEAMKDCWKCRDVCQDTLFNYCLQQGGEHVSPEHVTIMTDCIQICQTAADFLRRGSSLHESVCNACAEVCEECASSCEQMQDSQMDRCAELCRQCADSCQQMSSLSQAA